MIGAAPWYFSQSDHRRLQRALLQFFKLENDLEDRKALLEAGRGDLIGSGCDCAIPAQPPKAAIDWRRRRANEAASGDRYHAIGNPTKREQPGERVSPIRAVGRRARSRAFKAREAGGKVGD